MATALLQTKLSIPPLRREYVARTRLCDRLESGLDGKLTLISAPAGFGKSTLLSAWTDQSARPVIWLTLGEVDNDPERFWRYFEAALQRALGRDLPASIGALEWADDQDEAEANEEAITALINTLTTGPTRAAVLVVDDYHTIHNPLIHIAIERLVANLPPDLHLVIASRSDPPWPLARLRAQGDLNELRAPELRFTPAESAEFLENVMGLSLAPDAIEALEARTEGWIAGLQMAALSMGDGADATRFLASLGESHHFVMDYLLEEVLNRQPPARRAFLLQSAILERMSGSLAEAVTGIDDGDVMLRELEQANLFIAPLDRERRWYRYHQLFRELLLARLSRQGTAEVATLHIRASHWYERHGLLASAMRHATAAGDVERQVALIANNVLHLAYLGELRRLVRWLGFLPKEVGSRHPWLHISQAWVLAFAGHLEDVEVELTAVEHSLDQLAQTEGESPALVAMNRHVRGHAAAIRGYLAGLRSDTEESLCQVHEALELLPSEDRIARGWTTLLLAVEQRALHDFAAADTAFVDAVALGRAAGSVPLTTDALWERSWLQLAQGKLDDVLENSVTALALAEAHERTSGQRLAPTGYAHIGMATVFHERNDLERALEHARQAVQLSRRWGMADAGARSALQLALSLQAAGRTTEAGAVVVEAAQTASGVSPAYARIIKTELARVHIAQRNLAAAAAWAEENGLDAKSDVTELPLNRSIVLVRWLLAKDGQNGANRRNARRLLAQLETRARTIGAFGFLIEILILTALNEAELGRENAAGTALREALTLGEPQGYVRAFIAEGEAMRRLLLAALQDGVMPAYVGQLLAALDAEQGVHVGAFLDSALLEPLTAREEEILRLLPTSLSTTEMAEVLVVAPSTVRTHIKRIYGKLDVHKRAEAVARARELGLLSESPTHLP